MYFNNNVRLQHYCLFIKARFRLEILERILRVVRHRGFILCSLNMIKYHEKVDDYHVRICMTIVSDRSISLLISQLNKLIDVITIKIQ